MVVINDDTEPAKREMELKKRQNKDSIIEKYNIWNERLD